jgi:signal transduction histidine kinase
MTTAAARWSAPFARILNDSMLVVGAAVLVVLLATGTPDIVAVIAVVVFLGGYTTLGRIIVTRAGNTLGWIFLGIGICFGIALTAGTYVDASYDTPYVPSLPGTDVAGWLTGLFAAGALLIPMLFLLYPTGRPLTPRWRWVGWVWVVGATFSTVWTMFRPADDIYGEAERFTTPNPFGVPWLEPLAQVFLVVGVGCALVAAFAALASLVVRYRRASEVERQQIRWLMLVGLAALILFLLMPFAGEGSSDWLWIPLVLVLTLGLPAATALAIFRYRLYDVDLVISKTIVYAGLAVFIGAAYVAIVVGIGALFGGDGSNEALRIAATAGVALAFQPVRERLQRFANRLVYGKRATPYEVMAEFGHRIAGVLSAEDVLPDMAEAAARGVGGTAARVTVSLPHVRERSVDWPEGAEVVAPTVSLPVLHAGRRIGEVAVVKTPGDPLRPAERALLEDLAEHAGLALHNVRLTTELETKAEELSVQAGELRASRGRLVTARDAQRRRLERELREGVGAELGGIRDEIQTDARLVIDDPRTVETSLDALGARANAALDELRDVARGVFPSVLADRGLPDALEALVRKMGGRANLVIDPRADRRFEPSVENAVYFCCVQALQNAERHAPGSAVEVRLETVEGGVRFLISDDGPGFDPSSADAGEGMQIMNDRVAALAGELSIETARGRGTTVTGYIPAQATVVTSV